MEGLLPSGLPRLVHVIKKHCQVAVHEKYFCTSFSRDKEIANNDFQYHRDVIYSV